MDSTTRYVVITPVRNEEKHIHSVINSMLRQTIRPLQWVIVDDGSTDNTGRIIDRVSRQHTWIKPVHRTNRGFRRSGGGVTEAFYDGYEVLDHEDWNFVVLDLTDDFLRQYAQAREESRSPPEPDLMIMRDNAAGQKVFVTKVRLSQVYPDQKAGVADVLRNWQQTAVREGDEAVF